MQGDSQVVEHLNRVLRNRLTASHQYLLHAKMFAAWGLDSMHVSEYQACSEQRRFAEELIARILFLDGQPNVQDLGKLLIGDNAQEMLDFDLKLETMGNVDLKAAIRQSEAADDYVTRELLLNQLIAQEQRIDWLQTQLARLEGRAPQAG